MTPWFWNGMLMASISLVKIIRIFISLIHRIFISLIREYIFLYKHEASFTDLFVFVLKVKKFTYSFNHKIQGFCPRSWGEWGHIDHLETQNPSPTPVEKALTEKCLSYQQISPLIRHNQQTPKIMLLVFFWGSCWVIICPIFLESFF